MHGLRASVEVGTTTVSEANGRGQDPLQVPPGAEAAARAAEDAVEQLGQAHAHWNAVAADIRALLQVAGRPTGSLPSFPSVLESLVRDAKRAGGIEVPAPLPRDLPPASITINPDPHEAGIFDEAA